MRVLIGETLCVVTLLTSVVFGGNELYQSAAYANETPHRFDVQPFVDTSSTWGEPACTSACDITCLCDPACNAATWIEVDYVLLFARGQRIPALVAESAPGTPRPQVGILGDPATSVLLGNERLDAQTMSGVRLGFGHWLDSCGDLAVTGGLLTSENDDVYTFPGDAGSIISRPFFNVDPAVNQFDAELVNFAGAVRGSISVLSETDIFMGNIGLQKKLYCCADAACCAAKRLDAYVGYRSLYLQERLAITEALTADGGLIPAGTTFDVTDQFDTENLFHGLEVGLRYSWQRKRWTWEANGRVAAGYVHQEAYINGNTTITVPGQPSLDQPYGILASSSNIGSYERDRFGVLSQVQLQLSYRIATNWKLNLGYTFLSINNVARPGDQMDLFVNGTQIDPNVADVPPARPTFDWESDAFYLHGLNAGFEFSF